MRAFAYNVQVEKNSDPARYITEDEIIKEYYPYWSSLMVKAGRRPDMESCIEDWAVVHYAWEITMEEYHAAVG